MKLNLTSFAIAIVSALLGVAFVLWSLSIYQMLERQNQHSADALQQYWQSQVMLLQEKQALWLQAQFLQLAAFAEGAEDDSDLASHLIDYYQRNPTIWAVNLLRFDVYGQPVSQSTRSGCLQPADLVRAALADYQAPRLGSCSLDDKALLEISGKVQFGGETALLLVSMEYFSFLREFSTLSYRSLQRVPNEAGRFQFEEFGLINNPGLRVSVPLGGADGVGGDIHLAVPRTGFWDLFEQQAAVSVTVLFFAAVAALVLLHLGIIGPLQRLAETMRQAANSQRESEDRQSQVLRPGLGLLRDYLSELQILAKKDPVTGLNNRLIFEDRLLQAVRDGKRSGRKYALVLIDVRGLDDIAQQSGQYMADALLRLVADQLRERLRESDNLARFERNLFAVLLEIQERDQLEALVEKIYLAVASQHRVHGREFDLAAIIGVAVYPDHALAADNLYQNASSALVAAETNDWPIVFFREADESDTSGFSLIQALRRAIERDELKLVFQPVVDLQTYQTVYFEALLRWKDPRQHELSIDRTIRLAERNHLIKPLTNWIFESACRFISESEIDGLVVGINLSMIDLHDRQLPQRIETYLSQYQIKPAQIVIEITEGQIMQDPDEVIEVLAHLGVMGLSLSIDDFGTGQASLTYLKELPVEKLKIDQSFVRDIVSNPDDQLIVKATIELAHTLDLKVVAEGVETLAVYELLGEMACDHVQGYYVSYPLEADQVAEWFATAVKPDLVRKGR